MRRRSFLARSAAAAALAGGIGSPAIVRAASATTLKFVPYADLALLDPLVSAFVTRNHVMMVFDTLFALDEHFRPQYQMLAGHTVENDGKLWTLTLRDGLMFHDGAPVLGRDVVASLRRWGVADAFGQARDGCDGRVVRAERQAGGIPVSSARSRCCRTRLRSPPT